MQRRGGRAAFLPARLMFAPMFLGGAWFLIGARLDKTFVGGPGLDSWSMRLTVQHPSLWASNGGDFILGIVLLAVSGVLFGLSVWRPAAYRPLVVAEYGLFRQAFFLFAVAGIFVVFKLGGHVMEAGEGGLEWRFIADLRAAWYNSLTAALLFALSLASFAFAYGPLRVARASTQEVHSEELST